MIVWLLPAAYAVYCLISNPAGPITTPDSIHYLNLSPIVPLGYPFFLQLTGAPGAIVVQPLLFAAALALLGHDIRRATGSQWLAAAVVAGSMVVPQIREYHASILSESLFLSLLIVFLALAVRFTHRPSWHLMVLVALAVAASATVRRTGVAFVPVMLVMVLLQRHQLRGSQAPLFLVAALAPVAVVMATEQAVAPVVHAGASSSLMGRHMFAKAALIDAPAFAEATAGKAAPAAEDRVRRALEAELDQAYAPIREMLARAPGHVRGVLSIYYETCLQGGCADRARALTGETGEARQTEVMGEAGLARIRRAPLHFLGLTGMHYRSLWTVDRLRHPDTAPALNAFLARERPLPFEELALSLGPDRTLAFTPSARVRYVQYAVTAVAVGTGALAVFGVLAAAAGRRLPPALAAATVAALTAHGGLLLTALLAAGFTRFLLGLWPAIVLALGLGAWVLGSWGLRSWGPGDLRA